MITTINIEYENWIEKFKPHMDENDELIRYWDEKEKIAKAANDNKLWTQLDADGEIVIASGFHYVNRMDYFICDVAYEEDNYYEVID
jgi:hypothetical protein